MCHPTGKAWRVLWGLDSLQPPTPVVNSSPTHPVEALPMGTDHLLPSATIQDAQQWLHRNRFSQFCRLFASFSGEQLHPEPEDPQVSGKHVARPAAIQDLSRALQGLGCACLGDAR
ncbi:Hypothetical predicted protein [Marmota monax]|uniref:SAM domain-containing protein n=1 Tax=Marmota monax TaxID=9995 RepID=A0A5E4AQX1_MARMO|nr:hypothetical protein GHT09_008266 [Marmota monax]VTJ59704.1 Hypothetical predicted protein [Marmota monax]